MDTLSDPFNSAVVLADAFIVVVKPGLGVLEMDELFTSVVVFTGYLFFVAIQPAASINPTIINRANGTNNFIGGLCFTKYDVIY